MDDVSDFFRPTSDEEGDGDEEGVSGKGLIDSDPEILPVDEPLGDMLPKSVLPTAVQPEPEFLAQSTSKC
jgi:hypothetical protein